MRALQIGENSGFPVIPIFLEQQAPIVSGRAVRERPIECPDAAVDVSAERLVRGDNVAQGRGIVDDVVPSGFDAGLRREPVERQIGGQPWRIGEAAKGRQAVTQIRREKTWRGENHEVRDVVGFAGRHAQFAALARDAMHHGAGAHVASQLFE